MSDNEIAKEIYNFQPGDTVELIASCRVPDPMGFTSGELLREGTHWEFIRHVGEDHSELFYHKESGMRVTVPTGILARPN